MDSYLVKIKVLPSGPEVPVQNLLDSVKGTLPPNLTIKGSKEDPIAFGLYALIIDIVAPEEDGIVDKVEQAVSTAPLVTGHELLGVSRLSSRPRSSSSGQNADSSAR